jgi:hypothetical protein
MAVAVLFVTAFGEAATITAAPGGGQWHHSSTWIGGVVPASSDDVVLNAASGSVTISASQFCRSISCATYANTLTLSTGRQLVVGYVTSPPGNVVALGPSMTLNAGIGSVIVCGRPGGPIRGVATAGQVMPTVKTWNVELLDSMIATGNGLYCYEYFSTNSNSIVSTFVRVQGSTAVAMFGTSFIYCNWFDARNYAVCDVVHAALTVNGVIQANGVEFGNVAFTRGGAHEIRGSNSFEVIALTGASAATSITFQGGTTTTLTGADPLPGGDVGGQVSLGGYSAWTISAAIGAVSVDYVTLANSQAVGGATFEAGPNSIDGGGNSGWSF